MTLRTVMLMLALVVAGWGVGQLVQRAMPIGRDLSGDPAARAIIADRASPREAAGGADLVMVVFTDYRCPACRTAAPAMEAAVRADGRVTLIYKDWPIFGAPSVAAARVALATVPQGLYGAVHRALMAERRPLNDAVLIDVVVQAGGDADRLRRDLARHGAAIDAQLTTNARQAAALGLPGTPAYLIGPVLVVGALDADGFARAFAAARAAG
ncbi:DsbA family protein [Sphingomonas sp. 1P08PE]|uniref:DsbA family protein n=1 Tax=Sphingomonas sp. 1P08PE TaxID=554122 RepID=UPI0039A256DE